MTNLDSLFYPKSVALIGASATEEKLGGIVLKNLLGLKGRVYPVNPLYPELMGLKAYPSIRDLPETVDLSIVMRPAVEAPEIRAGASPLNLALETRRIAKPYHSGLIAESESRRCAVATQRTGLMHAGSLRIDGHCNGHILDVEFVDGFHAQVLKGQQARTVDRFRDEIRSAADGHQVNRRRIRESPRKEFAKNAAKLNWEWIPL